MKLYSVEGYLKKEIKLKNYKEIAKENKVSYKTIQRYLKKFKLTNPNENWTNKEIKILKQNYSNNQNVYSLFSNRSTLSINHKASRLGLKRDVRKNKYKINHNFFKKWSSEMAYILGFLFSDGNVSSKLSNFNLHLSSKDYKILKIIRKKMDSNHPLKFYDKTNSCSLRIFNKMMCKDLMSLGCVPKKSLILKFPDISDKYISHFIRGYFDGDGSIHFNKPNTIKISFISSKFFIKELQKVLNKKLKLKINKTRKYNQVYATNYYSNDARRLCHWMYRNSKDLYLKRKKDRFYNHIELRRQNGQL